MRISLIEIGGGDMFGKEILSKMNQSNENVIEIENIMFGDEFFHKKPKTIEDINKVKRKIEIELQEMDYREIFDLYKKLVHAKILEPII